MSLKSGRVGVARSEVDYKGKLKQQGAGGYTKEEVDAKLLLKEDASKIGGFEFRTLDGVAQYRTSEVGNWENFSSGAEVDVLYTGDGSAPLDNLTVTADFTLYEYIAVECIRETSSSILPNTITMFKTSELKQLNPSYPPMVAGIDYTRKISSFNDTTLVFGIGSYGSSTNSNWCIPVKVYGINGISF